MQQVGLLEGTDEIIEIQEAVRQCNRFFIEELILRLERINDYYIRREQDSKYPKKQRKIFK
ncbi:hypothetical protein D3C80_2179680 [compost metagenome]